jgi:hypothetical protein
VYYHALWYHERDPLRLVASLIIYHGDPSVRGLIVWHPPGDEPDMHDGMECSKLLQGMYDMCHLLPIEQCSLTPAGLTSRIPVSGASRRSSEHGVDTRNDYKTRAMTARHAL